MRSHDPDMDEKERSRCKIGNIDSKEKLMIGSTYTHNLTKACTHMHTTHTLMDKGLQMGQRG